MKFSFESKVNDDDKSKQENPSVDLGENKKYREVGSDTDRDVCEFGPKTTEERKALRTVLQKVLNDKNS